MSRPWRWSVVLGGSVALAAVPLVLAVLPVPGAPNDAAALLSRIDAARGRPYEGYAESTGYLALPVSGDFSSVTDLLGDRTQLRVWWADDHTWRVDTLSPFGEDSLRSLPTGTWQWDFEDDRATVTSGDADEPVRMPRAGDLLAPQLAARLLSEATPEEVSSLPSRRVAGRPADGLRLRPRDPDSSIAEVDVWADRASGIPVTVEVSAAGASRPGLTTTFLDFSPTRPAAADLSFSPPPGARIRTGARPDLVASLQRFAVGTPPASLLGYPRQPFVPFEQGVGLYGRGVTQVAVAALPGGRAAELRDQLQVAIGATKLPEGITVSVGPLGLLLTDPDVTGGRSWLVTGTLTSAGLAGVAHELAADASAVQHGVGS